MSKYTEASKVVVNDTKLALQTIYDSLNHGQQKQIVKDEKVKILFDRYGVEYTE